jgi:hypothetical protein
MYVLRNHVYSYVQVFVYECVFMLNPAHVWMCFQAHVADLPLPKSITEKNFKGTQA